MAYFQLEPWGTETEDLRTGIVASTIANANRDPKHRPQPYKPSDFVPQRGKEPQPEQDWEDQFRILQMIARTHNANK